MKEKMVTITRKIELKTNKEHIKYFKDVQLINAQISNDIYTSLLCLYKKAFTELEYVANDYKDKEKRNNIIAKVNSYTPMNEKTGKNKSLSGFTYDITKNYTLGDLYRSSIASSVFSDFKNDLYELLMCKISNRNYRDNCSVPFAKTKQKLICKDNDYLLKLEVKKGIVLKLNFGKDRSNNQIIVDRCLDGESPYKICDSSLQYVKSKNKVFLNLVIQHPQDDSVELNDDLVMGVDLGIKTPATCIILNTKTNSVEKYPDGKNDIHSLFVGDGKEVINKRNYFYNKRKSLQRDIVGARGGHGRKRKTVALQSLRSKESDWSKTLNHRYSKIIVNYALKHRVSVVKFEDLSFVKNKKEKFLKDWTYYQLKEFTKYKLEKYGIKLIEVSAYNTSKECSSCGKIHSLKLSDRTMYCDCGLEIDRDVNASINIARKIK